MSEGRCYRVSARTFCHALFPPRRRTAYVQRAVLALLRSESPRMVPLDVIRECVYGGDPEGGPLYPDNCIRVAILKLRRKGIPVINHFDRGYRLAS